MSKQILNNPEELHQVYPIGYISKELQKKKFIDFWFNLGNNHFQNSAVSYKQWGLETKVQPSKEDGRQNK